MSRVRKDVGTTTFANSGNAEDALTVMRACISAYARISSSIFMYLS